MEITFWGVRGSIPTPPQLADTRWKLKEILAAAKGLALADQREVDHFIHRLPPALARPVGGNTPCVEVAEGGDRIILDAGSGLRLLGLRLSHPQAFDENDLYLALEAGEDPGRYNHQPQGAEPLDLTILFSHTHWDHIQGWPFFAPAYQPGNRLSLYGTKGGDLSRALSAQQRAPALFPIALRDMGADLKIRSFPANGLRLGSLEIKALPMPHPGGSLAFRINAAGRSVVYATDYEFSPADGRGVDRFREFASGADLLISDTQYTYLESVTREGWGHTSSFGAVDLALGAGVGGLYLFHHDPGHSDRKLWENLKKTRAYYDLMSGHGAMRVELAVEGLTVEI